MEIQGSSHSSDWGPMDESVTGSVSFLMQTVWPHAVAILGRNTAVRTALPQQQPAEGRLSVANGSEESEQRYA